MTKIDSPEKEAAEVAGPGTGAPIIGSKADLVVQLSDWLIKQAFNEADIADLLNGCCKRLVKAGVPIKRAYVGFRTLHPLFSSVSLVWGPGKRVETSAHPHGAGRAGRQWRESPFNALIRQREATMRRRLGGPEPQLDFPILTDLRDQGLTDYFAFVVARERSEQDEIVGSWATDAAEGFSDHDLEILQRVHRWLAVACKVSIQAQIANNTLSAYLGPTAARHVLQGQIQRGDGQRIYAAIWFSDLRNSTGLADSLEEKDYLALLNSYFECTAGAVIGCDGDVLLLIGDAVLAIFPIEEGRFTKQEACAAAAEAARQACANLEDLNKKRETKSLPALDFGIGLHVGTFMFGNIGVPERLEFTATGPAVNETSRLEELTKTLGRPVLASEAFAQRVPIEWEALGEHELQGLGCCHRVFALPVAGTSRQAAE